MNGSQTNGKRGRNGEGRREREGGVERNRNKRQRGVGIKFVRLKSD